MKERRIISVQTIDGTRSLLAGEDIEIGQFVTIRSDDLAYKCRQCEVTFGTCSKIGPPEGCLQVTDGEVVEENSVIRPDDVPIETNGPYKTYVWAAFGAGW